MPEKKRYQSRIDATARYDKANTQHIGLKINKHTDADILQKLSSESNVQGYIKRLIREDIARSAEQAET